MIEKSIKKPNATIGESVAQIRAKLNEVIGVLNNLYDPILENKLPNGSQTYNFESFNIESDIEMLDGNLTFESNHMVCMAWRRLKPELLALIEKTKKEFVV